MRGLDVDSLLTRKTDEPKIKDEHNNAEVKSAKGRLFTSTLDFIVNGPNHFGWHNCLFRACCDLKEQGYSKKEATELLQLASRKLEGCLNKDDLYQIDDAFSRESKNPFRQANTEVVDRPIDMDHRLDVPESVFSGFLGKLVGTIEPHSEADPLAILIQAMVILGNVVGRNRYFQVEADKHYPNLFAVIVGKTSRARKGTSLGRALEVFKISEPEWFEKCFVSGLVSGEGLIWSVRDPVRLTTTSKSKADFKDDPGVSDKRLLVVESEFASVLKAISRESNTLSPTLRNAWDTGFLRTMAKNSPAKATNTHISLNCHITEEELLKSLSSTEIANGLANRFIWARVKRSKELPFGGQSSQINWTPLVKQAQQIIAFGRQPKKIELDSEAKSIWEAEYSRLTKASDGLYGAIVARSEAHVIRLSLIYAICDESEFITPVHLSAAIALWSYCDWSCHSLFGTKTGNKVADALYSAIQSKPDGLSRSEIRDFFSRNKSKLEVNSLLEVLIQKNLIQKKICEKNKSNEVWVSKSLEN